MPRLRSKDLPPELEPERVLPLRDSAKMLGISIDTLRRNFKPYIVQVTPHRHGMKLKHILKITSGPKAAG